MANPSHVSTNSTPAPGWTPERTDLAKRLWAQGISAARIAARLGGAISRCAVISKMYREKAPTGRDAPAPLRLADREGAKPARRDIHRSVARATAEPDRWRAPPEPEPAKPSPGDYHPPRLAIDLAAFRPLANTTPRLWETRRHGECAWPVEIEADDTVWSCCAPVQARKMYCEAHLGWRRDPAPPPSLAAMELEADALVTWLKRKGG